MENTRRIDHSDNHYDIEMLLTDEDGNSVWAVVKCSYSNPKENEMLDAQVKFTPAVLVTGQDEKGNEFTWWKADGKFVDAYNVREIEETEFLNLYPQVEKVYFSDTVMTGEQWRDIQCPLSMSTEQLEQWRENTPYIIVDEISNGLTDEEIARMPNSPWRASPRIKFTQQDYFSWVDNNGKVYTNKQILVMFDKWMNPQRSDIGNYIKNEQRGYNVR